MSLREGSEPENFWNALGGKSEYPKEKEIKGYTEDPHLFKLTYTGVMRRRHHDNFFFPTKDNVALSLLRVSISTLLMTSGAAYISLLLGQKIVLR